MIATPTNVIWKTPEEVDADRLAADYARLDRGEWIPHFSCALAVSPSNRGHKVEPIRPYDEER